MGLQKSIWVLKSKSRRYDAKEVEYKSTDARVSEASSAWCLVLHRCNWWADLGGRLFKYHLFYRDQNIKSIFLPLSMHFTLFIPDLQKHKDRSPPYLWHFATLLDDLHSVRFLTDSSDSDGEIYKRRDRFWRKQIETNFKDRWRCHQLGIWLLYAPQLCVR